MNEYNKIHYTFEVKSTIIDRTGYAFKIMDNSNMRGAFPTQGFPTSDIFTIIFGLADDWSQLEAVKLPKDNG